VKGEKEMAKNKKTKFITKDILKSSIIGSFQKLDPRYMIKNPVMFVVEIGCFITLLLTFVPTLFGGSEQYRIYNGIVTVILFVTVLFANFAESVAEGRGKAQAASLKKTKQDTKARKLLSDGTEQIINASELKKGDLVLVKAGELIPNDGEVIEGIASVDESAITGESAPVTREAGGGLGGGGGEGEGPPAGRVAPNARWCRWMPAESSIISSPGFSRSFFAQTVAVA